MSEEKISLRNENKCSNCNTYVQGTSSKCPTCGEEISHVGKDDTDETGYTNASTDFGDNDFLTCPSCRVVNSIDFETCQTCGYKLFEPAKLKTANHA